MDEYCSKMDFNGVGEFKCARAKHGKKMVARFGLDQHAAKPRWRCYGEVLEVEPFTKACITDKKRMTNEKCTDPDHQTSNYCGRTEELNKNI